MSLYKPGQSGNPAGKKKYEGPTVTELAKEHTAEAVACLADIMRTSKKTASRIAAARAILDRAWGRPPQAVTLKGDSDAPVAVQVIRFGDVEVKF